MLFVSQAIDLISTIAGPRFSFRVYLHRLERWRSFECEYYLLSQLVDTKRAAVDVGANIGIYAGRLAQLTGSVHCFEPNPALVEELSRKLDPSVVIHQCALSNRTGEAKLRIPYHGNAEWHGGATIEERNSLSGSRVKSVECDLCRLDDQIQEPVGFVKIDVEGHELAVLEGAERILREDKPVLLIESEHRHNEGAPENVFTFLQQRGYIGLFLEQGHLKEIATYRTASHQVRKNLTERPSEYIFNFIFVPTGHAFASAIRRP